MVIYYTEFYNLNILLYYLCIYLEVHDETRIMELHKKRNCLASYCKLVIYNIIPTKSAASIFKYYVKVKFQYTCI